MDLRKVDALVYENIFGIDMAGFQWPHGFRGDDMVREERWATGSSVEWRKVPHYSSDMAAAWQVVATLRKAHFAVRIETNRFPGYPLVGVWSNDTHPKGGHNLQGTAGDATKPEEAPLAICLAALKALGVEVPEE